MIRLNGVAHAKINLSLDILGRRDDSYHNLRMVMQEIALGDAIEIELGTGESWSMECDQAEIPTDDTNLCLKAARLFFEEAKIDCGGVYIRLHKAIPAQAGMGGGSADAASVLRLLYKYYQHPIQEKTLYTIAEKVGSDVPFLLLGGTALAEEKGQILTPLPCLPDCWIVLCKPPFPISTPLLYQKIDQKEIVNHPNTSMLLHALDRHDLDMVAFALGNVFTPIVAQDHPEIGNIKEIMLSSGALGAEMTGSGPTVFGIFRDSQQAAACHVVLKNSYRDTFIVRPL